MADNIVTLEPFRYWCHKVIPLVYDDSLSYYELLCKVVKYINTLVENDEILDNGIKTAEWNFNVLKNYVETYFDNLDVQEEINNKLDEMVESGALADIIRNYIGEQAEVYVWGYNSNYSAGVYQAFNLIKLGNGKNMLVDCGREDTSSVLSNFFSEHGVTKIDYIVITHYHNDHMGGFGNVCSVVNCQNATLFLPPAVNSSKAPAEFRNQELVYTYANANNMTVVQPSPNTEYDLTEVVKARFYNTNHDYYYSMSDDTFDYNDCSIVCEIVNNNTNILFTGDISPVAQNYIKDNVPHADILYMAHHGTNNQINREYIAHISPDVFVAMNGTGTSGTNDDFLNKYSAENYIAQKKNKWVYATSEQEDYIVKYTFNSFAYQFESKAIENNRTGEETYCLADFMEIPRKEAEQKSYVETLNALKNNSHSVFVAQAGHTTRPMFKSANFIEKYAKSNSSGYMNTQTRTYIDGEVYSFSSEQSTDLYHVFVTQHPSEDPVYHKELLTGLQYEQFQTYDGDDLTGNTVKASQNPLLFNDQRYWNGNFLTYNANGYFDVEEAGLYLVFVRLESNRESASDVANKTGSSGRLRLMRQGSSTPMGGMRFENIDNARTYETCVLPVYLSRTYHPYFDFTLTQGSATGVGEYNIEVVFARLSVDTQVDVDSFFGL